MGCPSGLSQKDTGWSKDVVLSQSTMGQPTALWTNPLNCGLAHCLLDQPTCNMGSPRCCGLSHCTYVTLGQDQGLLQRWNRLPLYLLGQVTGIAFLEVTSCEFHHQVFYTNSEYLRYRMIERKMPNKIYIK